MYPDVERAEILAGDFDKFGDVLDKILHLFTGRVSVLVDGECGRCRHHRGRGGCHFQICLKDEDQLLYLVSETGEAEVLEEEVEKQVLGVTMMDQRKALEDQQGVELD